MSRSRRKTKVFGITTAKSEKENKREANRKFRRIVKQRVKSDEIDFPKIREVSNVWGFDKDGKGYNSEAYDKDLRK